MLKRIILWRHGQTDANKNFRIQGAIDVPLNAVGLRQAQEAAQELAQLEPTRLYCSDLSRSRQSAQALADLTGLTPVVDARLQERNYGIWEGQRSEEIRQQWPEQWEIWAAGQEPGLGIETRLACSERMAACIEEAAGDVERSEREETVVFASHGGAITCAISTLLGLNPSQWQGLRVVDNCHWALLIPRPGGVPKWRLAAYNRWDARTHAVEDLTIG
ncbi:MAG: histidine phosphatase family protein [Actinomycetaceae bacterium]|nr:histidine phosphatase family protein [Actinomycetaceae bacterium]MDY5854670.1 histidine phosphatase family protein [Arcanobacterium sp.]